MTQPVDPPPTPDPSAFEGQVIAETFTDLGPGTTDAQGVLRAPVPPAPTSPDPTPPQEGEQ